MAGYFGTGLQQRLQRVSDAFAATIGSTPGACVNGRLAASDDIGLFGWDAIFAHLESDGAFGFRKEDTDLLEAFNAELEKFIGTPEHIALVEPFGFGEDFLPTKTTAELCTAE